MKRSRDGNSGEGDRILIADDEEHIIIGLQALLEEEGYVVASAGEGFQTLNILQSGNFALLLVDLKMPGVDGMGILKEIKKAGMLTEVIIITGHGSVATAVEAMKGGAYDYLTKPIEPDRLRSIIPKALEQYHLRLANVHLQKQIKQLSHYGELVGQSRGMREVYAMIEAVADTLANVIITGESGTGKELVARAIHKKSGRAHGPFIGVNCSAFPREILENELFGHESGAFTGALKEKQGCFELANGGTLFLDEIGEMSLETQAKILRALEERSFRRLGGKKEIAVDVRVVAATNRDVEGALENGALREDLYYRLAVVEIALPPLRERIDDIMLLVAEFLEFFTQKNNKRMQGLTEDASQALMHYPWPGNVRELRNAIERAVILCRSDTIDIHDLPAKIVENLQEGGHTALRRGATLEEVERRVIYETLAQFRDNKTKTAKALGVSLKTLHNKLKKYGGM